MYHMPRISYGKPICLLPDGFSTGCYLFIVFFNCNLFFFWNFKRCRVAGLELNITLLEMGQAGGFNWSYLVVFIVYIDCIKFL